METRNLGTGQPALLITNDDVLAIEGTVTEIREALQRALESLEKLSWTNNSKEKER